MLNSDKEGEEVFFDAVESASVNPKLVFDKSEYEVWWKQPGSVQERRERFLCDMGFGDFGVPELSSSHEIEKDTYIGGSSNFLGLDRLTDMGEAVSSSTASFKNNVDDEDLHCCRRMCVNGETKFSVFETEKDRLEQLVSREGLAREEQNGTLVLNKKKMRRWWNYFTNMKRRAGGFPKSDVSIMKEHKANRIKVSNNKKKFMELTALHMGQEIQAHRGFIWTMKFSPDGQYLASGGEDGVVRVWRVTSTNASFNYSTAETSSELHSKMKGGSFNSRCKNVNPVVLPEKFFKIKESPLQEFHGHTSDVLDLSWSNSNCLLSSSKDKTVRLWKVGCNECLNVFHHTNYVTCVQFNPVDNGYFISGCIDGKVRMWGVSERRVIDWADVRHIITALCFQPDGQQCIVGSITGNCSFYDATCNRLQLDAQICIQGRNKSSGNRITGIQFCHKDSQRVAITSADSRVRIFHGVDVIHKYRGLQKSGSQMSASFTANGRHIISVGEDSRVYIWNNEGFNIPSSKREKSVRSCENFLTQGVSIAIPWSGMKTEQIMDSDSPLMKERDAASLLRDSECFSLGRYYSMNGSSRSSATWPEEKLMLMAVPGTEQNHNCRHKYYKALSATWGLVIVTAGLDGVIRTFQNYGLPVRL